MVFNSYTFIVFFIIMLVLHNLPLPWKVKKVNLLLASYIFYAAWNPPFILLLWLSTVVDFFVGRALYTQKNKHKRRALLVVSLIGNLGMLCFFKYGAFLLENFVHLSNVLGFDFHPAKPNIILPAGISFYTFTTLCYTVDMYKRKSEPVKSMLDFSLFVTFFPHLVAGPIVRPPQLVPQFETPRTATKKQLINGLMLLSLGLFMKVVLADAMLSATADSVFGAQGGLRPLDAWAGVLAFSGQIFFDFAGYSTSGNRQGKFRTYINLMITMLIGGLWHGANWTFVAWGGIHGLYLWIEKLTTSSRAKTPVVPGDGSQEPVFASASVIPGVTKSKNQPGFLYALLTFLMICITWVFFRSATFAGAGQLLLGMFGQAHGGPPLLSTIAIIKVGVIITLMLVFHWVMRNTTVLTVTGKLPWWLTGTVWAIILVMIILSQETGKSFIYFQF